MVRTSLCGALALALSAGAQQGQFRAPGPLSSLPRLPRVSPAYRNELPAAFNKAAPESIADLEEMQRHVEALISRLSPAVVAVEVGYGTGSGVVISPDGLVLTAGHVCERPGRNARFTFPDGKTVSGKTVGLDEDSDTGLMRITQPGPWPHADLGALDKAELGDWVLAFGHPGGFDPKRSLVVRLGRLIRLTPDALQSDCTIAPGDSGGPLFDMHGRVVGIHSAISTSLADNFHVPISEFVLNWEQLARGGRSSTSSLAAYLGATPVQDPAGCRLQSVERNSPASKAGLRAGDVILKVEDRDVKAVASLTRWLEEARPGETLHFQVQRDAKVLSLQVKLGVAKK
ncbi:MAG TPA: trypsin-like peptidase domain-containing protein [Verrucomicrobiae bacterium]|nr:trypsin-like peptidase domain-containing protein [Verrucomicrobiae bacterium]